MDRLKRIPLGMVYAASLPWRKVQAARRAATGNAPVMVLFYHRVADTKPNDWTISNQLFEREIDWIGRHFDLVSLEEGQRRLCQGNHRPAVCITFDDGYAENCERALPMLIERGIPVTYFVATQFIEQGNPFPHDERCGCPLAPNRPEQLQEMASAGIEIGAHTRTHADLGSIDNVDQLYDEVVTATHDLEKMIDRPVRYFAFPFGLQANLNSTAFQMARDAGLSGVCSAYGGYNFPGDDPFHLQRIHGDADMLRLRNWLSVNPRKIRKTQRFETIPVPQDRVGLDPIASC